jgi:hypothetical protein
MRRWQSGQMHQTVNLAPLGLRRFESYPTHQRGNYEFFIMIIFTKHAENKFEILRKHKFLISKNQVIKTINKPDLIDNSRLPLLIAQKKIDKNH